jgi:hypothetical protein
MRGKALVFVLAVGLLLAGCSEPTIDGSSERAFHDSAAKVASGLPPDERWAFTDALLLVTMTGIDFGEPLAEGEQLDFEGAIARLHGMSAEEIMAMAEELRLLHFE